MFDQVQIWTKSAPVCWKLFHNAKEERTEGKKDCRSLRQQVTVNLVIRISRFNLTSPKPYTVRLSLSFHSQLFLPCNQYLPQLLFLHFAQFPLCTIILTKVAPQLFIPHFICCPVLCQTHYRDPNTFFK